MERLLSLRKKIFVLTIALSCIVKVFCQHPTQAELLKVQVWANIDEFPGIIDDSDEIAEKESVSDEDSPKDDFNKIFGYSIEQTKKIAPYLIGGMINGWTFDYTPSDKMRNVKEFWEFADVREFNRKINKIEYKNPVFKDEKIICWAYCERTEQQKLEYKSWNSIVHPRVKGTGAASVQKGFDGIKEACSLAAKSAVREYWRLHDKNKPKEITGSLLLIKEPRIYIKNGQYVVDLDFFLKTDRIVSYVYY